MSIEYWLVNIILNFCNCLLNVKFYHTMFNFERSTCTVFYILLIMKIWDRLPHLKAVVQYIGELVEGLPPNVYTVS